MMCELALVVLSVKLSEMNSKDLKYITLGMLCDGIPISIVAIALSLCVNSAVPKKATTVPYLLYGACDEKALSVSVGK